MPEQNNKLKLVRAVMMWRYIGHHGGNLSLFRPAGRAHLPSASR